jgi:hypothetical protein
MGGTSCQRCRSQQAASSALRVCNNHSAAIGNLVTGAASGVKMPQSSHYANANLRYRSWRSQRMSSISRRIRRMQDGAEMAFRAVAALRAMANGSLSPRLEPAARQRQAAAHRGAASRALPSPFALTREERSRISRTKSRAALAGGGAALIFVLNRSILAAQACSAAGMQRRNSGETNLSAEQTGAQAPAWLSRPDGDEGRPQGSSGAPRPRAQAAQCLSRRQVLSLLSNG